MTPKALVGFDGFVDSLYRVVRSRNAEGKETYASIPEFAQELGKRAGLSGGFGLERLDIRFGGNAPLMASGLQALGIQTTCVAALGAPVVHASFAPLAAAGVELISGGDVAQTVALEFGDGKVMLNDTHPLEALNWAGLSQTVGLDRLRAAAKEATLIALVDWANLAHGADLWRGFLEDVLAQAPPRPGREIFFDLADIDRRSSEETKALMPLLKSYCAHGRVSLGLNENEARKLSQKMGLQDQAELAALGSELFRVLGIDLLIIHPRDRALVFDAQGVQILPGQVVQKPKLTTGGGDHFNAGLCWGLLQGWDAGQAAQAAVTVSGKYVELGHSPSLLVVTNAMKGLN